MEVDTNHVDLFCTDQREISVSLKQARRFAEYIEAAELAGRLRARLLPRDSAEIIRKVRNNLVHWSEAALSEQLSTGITVRDFIESTDAVRTVILDVANYISDEYYVLRQFERTGII